MRSDRDKDFSPRLLQTWRRPPSPLPRVLMGTVAVLIATLLIWAYFGKLDIVARARGSLVPATRVKIVQPFEGGRVKKILVEEGERVEAGQTLMRMDTRLSRIDTDALKERAALARLNLRRIAAELAGRKLKRRSPDAPDLFEQVASRLEADRTAYRNAVETQRAALDKARDEKQGAERVRHKLLELLPIYRSQEQAYASLGKSGNVSRQEMMDKRRRRIEAERALEEQRQKLASLDGGIRQIRSRIEQLKSEHRRKLVRERADLRARLDEVEAKLKKQAYRSRLQDLTAPQSGVVKDLATHTEGYVVPSGTVLMTLVPEGEPLQAEVYVGNQDIGFVREDQTARIKLAPYPFQRYGTIDARVSVVSPDAQDPKAERQGKGESPTRGAYKAILALDRQYLDSNGRRFELKPGMTVIAEINLGRRTVLDYLLSPVRRTLDFAGNER